MFSPKKGEKRLRRTFSKSLYNLPALSLSSLIALEEEEEEEAMN
jgi:hypothetical protein